MTARARMISRAAVALTLLADGRRIHRSNPAAINIFMTHICNTCPPLAALTPNHLNCLRLYRIDVALAFLFRGCNQTTILRVISVPSRLLKQWQNISNLLTVVCLNSDRNDAIWRSGSWKLRSITVFRSGAVRKARMPSVRFIRRLRTRWPAAWRAG